MDLWREHTIGLFLIETTIRVSCDVARPPSRMWSLITRSSHSKAMIGIAVDTVGGLRISWKFRERYNLDVTSEFVGDWEDCGLLGNHREGWHCIFRHWSVTVFGCLAFPRFEAESHETLLLVFIFGRRRSPPTVLSILDFLLFLLLFGRELLLFFSFFFYFLPLFFRLLILLNLVFIGFGGFRKGLIQVWSFTKLSMTSKAWGMRKGFCPVSGRCPKLCRIDRQGRRIREFREYPRAFLKMNMLLHNVRRFL